MTYLANIAGSEATRMVPEANEKGTLMAYLLPAYSLSILGGFNPTKAILRQLLGNIQAIPLQENRNTGQGGHDGALDFSPLHKDRIGLAGPVR